MHQNNILRHNKSGELLRLIRLRKSNINTFVQVDKKGNPIIKKRKWSHVPTEQYRLISGFENLTVIK